VVLVEKRISQRWDGWSPAFRVLGRFEQDCCSRYWISDHKVDNMPYMHDLVARGYEGNGYLPTEIAKLHRAMQPKGKSLVSMLLLC
jgi:hypothetical protein